MKTNLVSISTRIKMHNIYYLFKTLSWLQWIDYSSLSKYKWYLMSRAMFIDEHITWNSHIVQVCIEINKTHVVPRHLPQIVALKSLFVSYLAGLGDEDEDQQAEVDHAVREMNLDELFSWELTDIIWRILIQMRDWDATEKTRGNVDICKLLVNGPQVVANYAWTPKSVESLRWFSEFP